MPTAYTPTPRDKLRALVDRAEQMAYLIKATPAERERAKREAEIQAAAEKYFGVLSGVFGKTFETSPPNDPEAAIVIMRMAQAEEARAALIAELQGVFAAAYISGATGAVAEVGLALTAGFNAEAARWARDRAGELITEIDATTLEVVRKAVERFVTTPGATLQDIIDRLPFGEARARLIGITESTAAFAEGNQSAANALAKKYPDVAVVKTWLTNNDDRVCSICAPLDGAQVAYNSAFPGGIDNPPAHPGCRCSTSYRTDL